MKIILPAPAVLSLPGGKTLEYSLPEMARYLARNSRRFGAGGDVERLRMGQRIEEAFDNVRDNTVELADADGKQLLAEIQSPSCGWANLTATIPMQVGVDDKGQPQVRQVTRRIRVAGLEILPLIEGTIAGASTS